MSQTRRNATTTQRTGKSFDPLSREAHDTMLAMLAECRPAAIPEKIVQHPPVYMATLPYARDHDELDAFIESRDLNRACADDIRQGHP